METRKMNTVIWSLLGLATVALLLFATAESAEAAVRVNATVRTPYGTVHVDNGYHRGVRVKQRRPLPFVRRVEVRITKQDRRMAKRLTGYLGVPKRELLQLKRQGYRWVEIGRGYGLSRSTIRAARSGGTWRRFLRNACRYEGNGRNHDRDDGRRGGRRDVRRLPYDDIR